MDEMALGGRQRLALRRTGRPRSARWNGRAAPPAGPPPPSAETRAARSSCTGSRSTRPMTSPCVDVQRALLDQVRVDRGVEPAVVDDVVDVAVRVVVHPAGGDGAEGAVGAARRSGWGLSCWVAHRGRFCQRRAYRPPPEGVHLHLHRVVDALRRSRRPWRRPAACARCQAQSNTRRSRASRPSQVSFRRPRRSPSCGSAPAR